MKKILPGVRNAVRALIYREDQVLLQHKVYEGGRERYVLPGGAPDDGESLADGLRRECREEIGCEIKVVDLLHVADFLKPRETDPPTWRQQVEFIFLCIVEDRYIAQNGPHPDKHQNDVVWVPLADLNKFSLFPPGLEGLIQHGGNDPRTYVGWMK